MSKKILGTPIGPMYFTGTIFQFKFSKFICPIKLIVSIYTHSQKYPITLIGAHVRLMVTAAEPSPAWLYFNQHAFLA